MLPFGNTLVAHRQHIRPLALSKQALYTLRRRLKPGDYVLAARLLGGKYTRQYIAMVAKGAGGRHNEAIINTLTAIATENKQASERLTRRIAQLK